MYLLIIPFEYISNDIPLPGYASNNPSNHIFPFSLPFACMRASPTPPFLPYRFSILLPWGINP